MPFPWIHPQRVKRAQNRTAMYRRELEEKAALLHRLAYPRAAAKARLVANIGWDFEVGAGGSPIGDDELEAILDQAWKRGGSAHGGAPNV